MNICLVSTICNAQKALKSFIDYHISIGFEHLFLFVDNNDEMAEYEDFRSEKVSLIRSGKALSRCWNEMPSAGDLVRYTDVELIARQCLNAEVAMELGRLKGYDWILHIDVDELFKLESNEKMTLSDYFSAMTSDVIWFRNVEAIPEKLEINDYFKEVSLFKRNYFLLEETERALVDAKYASYKKYFKFYRNGKAAANLHSKIKSDGPHRFQGKSEPELRLDASIFHFPCCGLNHFISKYKRLGNFKDKWFDYHDIKEDFPMHIQSRELLNKNPEPAEVFYTREFINYDKQWLQEFLDKGIFFRNHFFEELNPA